VSARLDHLATEVGPDVLAYLVRRTEPVDAAADVYAQVLAITWRKIRVVPTDDREAFAWMLGVARRCLANHRRGACRRRALADRLREALPSVVQPPDSDAAIDAQRALARLGAADRELVTLIYWEQPSTREAAGILNISESAARKRLSRARTRMRDSLATV